MATKEEIGGRGKGILQMGAGVLVEGIGVGVDNTLLSAPVTVGRRLFQAIGTESLPDFGSKVLHAPFDLLNMYAHAGFPALAAGVTTAVGLFFIGRGAVNNYKAKVAAGKA